MAPCHFVSCRFGEFRRYDSYLQMWSHHECRGHGDADLPGWAVSIPGNINAARDNGMIARFPNSPGVYAWFCEMVKPGGPWIIRVGFLEEILSSNTSATGTMASSAERLGLSPKCSLHSLALFKLREMFKNSCNGHCQ